MPAVEPPPPEVPEVMTSEKFLGGIGRANARHLQLEAEYKALNEEILAIDRQLIRKYEARTLTPKVKGWKREWYQPELPISADNPGADLIRRMRQLQIKSDAVLTTEREAKEGARAAAMDLLSVPKHKRAGPHERTVFRPVDEKRSYPTTDPKRAAAQAESAKRTDEALDWFNAVMVPNEKWNRIKLQVKPRMKRMCRASANQGDVPGGPLRMTQDKFGWETRRSFVNIRSHDPVGTYVHEIAHTIEFSDKEIRVLLGEWRATRVGSEKLSKLRELLPGSGYRTWEVAWKDEFVDAYIGKYYRDGCTEVLSMGCQMLFEDPVRFARRDPEMFDLIMRVLCGAY